MLAKSIHPGYLGRYNDTTPWEAQSDDEDFERDTGFYLSGPGDEMPSRDIDIASCYPRHGPGNPNRPRHREDVFAEDDHDIVNEEV